MGFPSPAADYQESALNLNEIMISHPSATILVPTANGWLLVDKSISPVRGNQLYFLLWGQEKIEFCGTTQSSALMEKKSEGKRWRR